MTYKGPWNAAEVEAFLQSVQVPVRIACNGRSGHPVLASLWFVPIEGRLWCATQRSAHIVSILERDPRCAFEVSVETPPYRGVRGPAVATLETGRGEEILRAALERYLGDTRSPLAARLLARADQEVAISVAPRTIVSWDYAARMKDAV